MTGFSFITTRNMIPVEQLWYHTKIISTGTGNVENSKILAAPGPGAANRCKTARYRCL